MLIVECPLVIYMLYKDREKGVSPIYGKAWFSQNSNIEIRVHLIQECTIYMAKYSRLFSLLPLGSDSSYFSACNAESAGEASISSCVGGLSRNAGIFVIS